MKKVQSGFTLIELMIVIVILGLLASLVAPEMFGKVASSKRKNGDDANENVRDGHGDISSGCGGLSKLSK